MTDELIDSIVSRSGSTIVRVDDVTTVALDLVERLDGKLVEGAAEFAALAEERRRDLAERAAAHAALELIARSETTPGERVVVNDLAGLRSLVGRLEEADRLLEAVGEDARQRIGSASGLAVHPTTIRDAAADVLDARATVLERRQAIEQLDEPESGSATDVSESDDGSDDPATAAREPGLRLTDVAAVRWAGVVAAAALAIGVLVVVLTGNPLALVLPAVGVAWLTVVIVRQRDDSYDEKIASRNLENVARLTDRAYGGAGLLDGQSLVPENDPERTAAERALADAEDRLAYAEASWRSLVGPDADVEDVEAVVRARDAQYGLSDAVVVELPSHRAASAHRRRLHAQWKLAWWALDRPVPDLDGATAALDALEAEGVDEIAVDGKPTGGLDAEERARLDDLAAGRSADELRTVAERAYPVVVVVDDDHEIDEALLRAETAQLPDDVRFVVVSPDE